MNQQPLSARRAFSRIGLAVAGYEVSVIVLVLLLSVLAAPYASRMNASFFSFGIAVVAQYLLGVPLFRLMLAKMPTYRYPGERMSAWDMIGAAGGMVAVATVGSVIGNMVVAWLEKLLSRTLYDTTDFIADNMDNWLCLLVVIVIGPTAEELIFRKWMIDRLRPYGEGLTIVVTSLLFALTHGNFEQLFYTFGMGLIAAYVYMRTKRIGYCIGLHIGFNLLLGAVPQWLVSAYPALEESELALDAVPPLVYAATWLLMLARIGLMVTGIVYVVQKRKRFCLYGNANAVPKGKRFGVVIGNVGMILCLLVVVGLFAVYLLE